MHIMLSKVLQLAKAKKHKVSKPTSKAIQRFANDGPPPAGGLPFSSGSATSSTPQNIADPGGQSGGIIQKKSIVNNEGTNYVWGPSKQTVVGRSMHAYLDPADPVQGEEANINTNQSPMMNAIRDAYGLEGGALVKGHLLNANVGGKALNNNLFPITKTANGDHLRTVENVIKNRLWVDKKLTYYNVEVTGFANIANSKNQFKTTWGDWDGQSKNPTNLHSVTIPSDFGDAETSSGEQTTVAGKTNEEAATEATPLALSPHTKVSQMNQITKDIRKNQNLKNIYRTLHTAESGEQNILSDKELTDDLRFIPDDPEEESLGEES